MTKFKNKYRIDPARLEGYDYSKKGLYFITVCTGGRNHYFGEIINGEMHLSRIGKIAEYEWYKTLEIRKDMNLQLHEFVVMPNHIHGIIEIGDNDYNNGNRNHDNGRDAMLGVSHKDNNFDVTKNVGNKEDVVRCGDAKHRVSTEDVENNTNTEYKNTFSSQSKNIASIIRGYKSAVTINARRLDDDFSWQTRFHDHVIRNANSYLRISNYIIANPENWKEDRYF